jgi:ribosomal protein S18 acetylase RimI-like enzyme
MRFQIVSPESREDFERYYELRWRLLREPWGQPRGSERDELESQSLHLMARVDAATPVGVARLHFNSVTEAQIRYMAVDADCRGQGIGRALLKALELQARARGACLIVLHAREAAVGFYEQAGYEVVGASQRLFGIIPHFAMRKPVG